MEDDDDFARRVYDGYMALASENPGRVRVVDASGDVEQIAGKIRQILSES
jgi:thymidylate kinase